MTEAGQIFALLRSSSAAELARRFNAVEGESGGARLAWGATGGAALGGAVGGAGQGAALPQSPAAGGTANAPGQAQAPATGGGTVVPGTAPGLALAPVLAGPVPSAAQPDGSSFTQPPGLRAWASMDHLAPPRSDALRLMTDAIMAGLARLPGAAAGGVLSPALAGALTAEARLAATAAALAGEGDLAATASGKALDQTATTVNRTTVGSAAVAAGGPVLTSMVETSGRGAALAGPTGPAGATAAQAATGPAEMSGQGPSAVTEGRTALTLAAATGAQVAFADALVALMDAAGSGRAGSVASGVIFNAAMIPGWPFPSAFARDGAEAINPKALLHRLAATIEGMSPEEAAEYMAKVGSADVILRNLRKILKELEGIDKEDVKGFLSAFLDTISTIATSLQTAFQQLADSATLQAAVVHGENPDDGDRPGRRRLRL